MSFSNKVVIVTGASSGIGAATAILFAKEGADIAMADRDETKLKNIAEKVAEYGKQPLVIIADVTKDEDAARIIKETVDKFGTIDVLCNIAGSTKYGTITEGNILDCYDFSMSINVRAVINLTTLAAPHLIATKGNIVNIGSVAALKIPSNPKLLPYAISKAALNHFTRGAALELSSTGVRVNSINPGPVKTSFWVNTNMTPEIRDASKPVTPLYKMLMPDEIADMVLYLAGDKAKGITGSIVVIDNGVMLAN